MEKENNPMHKGKEYYETTPVFRANFKRVCIRNSWKFENFQEIWDGTWFKVDGYRRKRRFTYVEKMSSNEVMNIDYNKRDKSYYSTHATRRETFKKKYVLEIIGILKILKKNGVEIKVLKNIFIKYC